MTAPAAEVDVVIIGGGATGAGVLRDLAMRGLRTLLVERGDFASGTSGRYHGLLHSGARYVESDPVSARHCAEENEVLRRIAPATIEPTEGYFVATPDDPDDYLDRFPAACSAAGVEAEPVPLADLFAAEPLLNRQIRAAYRVRDASLEPWELVDANLASAREHGAQAWRYHEVIGFDRDADGGITAVRVRDVRTGEEKAVACRAAVSASGAWAGKVAALAGARLTMSPGKGSMLILNRRMTKAVVNRLAPPGDGDIIVPVHTVCILGTTDVTVPDPDNVHVTDEEITALLADGDRLVPGLSGARVLRTYAGSRPLYDASELDRGQHHEESREISRAHHVIDHGSRDGVGRFWSIVGGKLTTYRLMARDTADAVAAALGVDAPCRTGDEPLPKPADGAWYWLGDRLAAVETEGGGDADLICECEIVTRARLEHALDERGDSSLDDLRRTTRLGMGPCQGAFCMPRAAALLDERAAEGGLAPEAPPANEALRAFMAERFKGTRPIAWGEQLLELWLTAGIYRGVLAVDELPGATPAPAPAPVAVPVAREGDHTDAAG
ncbi:MAG TPA: anaerobic glycerol-3-phosphate dehydrogenase subunit GlpA [Candidatus Limnocylindria bacterium]|nr:anaerobic glycerol-3-phosphate dehydrogenase subunit GlpA [Candidatus Limnocylindria bacterium]